MARPKGSPKVGGRAKGTPNRTTSMAKEAIALAAEKLGGTDRIVAWAQEDPKNEAAFWTTIYPKLMPVQVEGSGDGGQHLHEVAWRIVDSRA